MREHVTTDAVLLRAVATGESDLIVTLFTSDLGRVGAVARGARRSRRRFAGALEPYCVVRVELKPGRSDLMALLHAEVVRAFPELLSELSRIEAAGSALSLVREVQLDKVAEPALFVSIVQYLTLLDHQADERRAALLAFAVRVLALSGLTPRLTACARSGELVPEGKAAYFDPQLGAVVARRLGGGPFLLSAAARTCLIAAQGEQWLSAALAPWSDDDLHGARCALSAFIAAHLSGAIAKRLFPGP